MLFQSSVLLVLSTFLIRSSKASVPCGRACIGTITCGPQFCSSGSICKQEGVCNLEEKICYPPVCENIPISLPPPTVASTATTTQSSAAAIPFTTLHSTLIARKARADFTPIKILVRNPTPSSTVTHRMCKCKCIFNKNFHRRMERVCKRIGCKISNCVEKGVVGVEQGVESVENGIRCCKAEPDSV